ncbi:MAG: hypothetical protein VKK43_03010 [Synechococcaceae cyanobacterium]|nr:hypothetical protein [Synechococcaceae cyanobacterium]
MAGLLVAGAGVPPLQAAPPPPTGTAAGSPVPPSPATASPTEYASSDVAGLVAFVTQAAAEIAARGEASFDDFRRPGGPWLEGDRYLFVWDLQGNRYVYPPDIEHESGNKLEM